MNLQGLHPQFNSMKTYQPTGFLFALALAMAFAHCQNETSDEAVARRYCGSCHLFPEPSLLPKQNWITGVLPAMQPLLGMITDENNPYATVTVDELMYLEAARYYPAEPVLSAEEWERIRQYYLTNAPDSLPKPQGRQPVKDLETRFELHPVAGLSKYPATTLIKSFPAEKKYLTGFQDGTVLVLNEQFVREDSLKFATAVSDVVAGAGGWIFAEMGDLNPSDLHQGAIWLLPGPDTGISGKKLLLDKINRPAELLLADLTGDGAAELAISEFGHQLGSFSWLRFEGPENPGQRQMLMNTPGARTAKVADLDKDGAPDLIVLFAQGNECIRLFKNEKNGNFSQKILLQFPSVNGSSYFELADMNDDGFEDIIYANGDNADYSVVFKPYHGIRVFLNDGRLNFTEKWFYPMNGASKTVTRDFDRDGDPDIAAISFFPDLKNAPEESFSYFENNGNLNFEIYGSPKTSMGRWLVMEVCDFDHDGFEDLILGSCVTALRLDGSEPYARQWIDGNVSMLKLKNKAAR